MITIVRRRTAYHEPATLRPCPRCRRHVLTGRTYGFTVIVDPENITVRGELLARIQSRQTYDLRPGDFPPRLYIRWRGLDEVRGERKWAVVADHKCGSNSLPSEPAPAYRGLLILVLSEFPVIPPF